MTSPTPRGRMSQKRRQHIFSEHCTGHHIAPCCLCGKPIHRHDDEWIIEHVRALGLLGKDTNTNCGPAHVACAAEKTHKQDLPRIRKAKRQALATMHAKRLTMHGSAPISSEGVETPQTHATHGVASDFLQAQKKPARAFQVPAGVVFDWKRKRYVRATAAADQAPAAEPRA